MPDGSIPLLISLIILVLLSGFFSSTETAYTSASRIKLRSLASNGKKRAEKTLNLAENKFDKLISTILVGNNIVNLTAATLSTIFFAKVLPNGINAELISTIVITVTVLIFGEITPKFIAKTYPEKFAMTFYPLVMFFYYILLPFNLLFSGWKWLIGKIFHLKADDIITEEEIMTMVEEAEEDGTIHENETNLIRSVIEFDDLEVGDILVPRVNIVAVEINDSFEDIRKKFEKEGYSRLPVYKDSIDTIIGTIHEKDFFSAYLKKKNGLDGILQNAFYTTEHVKISKLLKQLQKSKIHICIVLDEYGGTLGLITLEDILEELVGEIYDEHDEEINYFKKLSENVYQVDGNVELDEFFDFFKMPEQNDMFEANTLSGWVIEKLGEIPRAGFKFSHLNLDIEVLKSSVKKVQLVKVIENEIKEDEEE